jgi:hypothetical protein
LHADHAYKGVKMSYQPIAAMSLKSTQITIPTSTVSSLTTVALGTISDSSVITKSGDTLILPAGRSYFITANLNFSQATGNNAEFSFYDDGTSTKLTFQSACYVYYASTNANADTYDGTMMVVVAPTSDLTISLRKSIHAGASTFIQNSSDAYIVNSGIQIFYTD